MKRPVYKPAPTANVTEKNETKVPVEVCCKVLDKILLYTIKLKVQPAKDTSKVIEQKVDKEQKPKDTGKPIISEADSTEMPKVNTEKADESVKKKQVDPSAIPEGPPGVSPSHDPPPDNKKKVKPQLSNDGQKDKTADVQVKSHQTSQSYTDSL